MDRMDKIFILGLIINIIIAIVGVWLTFAFVNMWFVGIALLAIFAVDGLLMIIFEIHKDKTLND